MIFIKKSFLLFLFLVSNSACSGEVNESKQSVISKNVEYFKVIAVKSNDTLSLRESASGKSKIIFKLPHDASGMLKLTTDKGWVKLSYKEHIGWAYGKYLKRISAPNIKSIIKKELSCLGTEPHWILQTNNNKLIYKKYDEQAEYFLNSSILKNKKNTWLMTAVNPTASNTELKVEIKYNNQCTDEMSDNKYTYSISVQDKQLGILNGCCN